MFSLSQTPNPSLTMGETSDKSHLRDLLQSIWPELLKTVNVIKNNLKHSHNSQKETSD